MSASDRERSPLEEFKDFIAFLRNLWSILASVSVLFPLSNALMGALTEKSIPLQTWGDKGGAFSSEYFPNLATTIATLTCLFIVLWIYGGRHKLKAGRKRSMIQRQALVIKRFMLSKPMTK